jgi:hypothetical protein
MPKTLTQDERQLIKLVEKMPLPEEEKSQWLERMRGGEMSSELADEIRQKLSEDTGESEQNSASRTRYLAEFAVLIRRWRLSSQSHNFGRK